MPFQAGISISQHKLLSFLILIIVSLSTLFTGQHYVADIFGGLLVAFMGYHFGLRWARFALLHNRPAKTCLLLPPSSRNDCRLWGIVL
jgi:membrane-associated phospholipid phosphatase